MCAVYCNYKELKNLSKIKCSMHLKFIAVTFFRLIILYYNLIYNKKKHKYDVYGNYWSLRYLINEKYSSNFKTWKLLQWTYSAFCPVYTFGALLLSILLCTREYKSWVAKVSYSPGQSDWFINRVSKESRWEFLLGIGAWTMVFQRFFSQIDH